MSQPQKRGLGKGLGALLGDAPVPTSPNAPERDGLREIPVAQITPNPFQPRKTFEPGALDDLKASIAEFGVLVPIIVRKRGDRFELIAGERRWRAAQLAGVADVPVIVRQADDRAVLEMALIENLQRENLNPIEEAQGYAQLVGQFNLTQEEVAAKVGKSRAAVANAVRLLKLAPALQAYLREGRLSVGHAKVILGMEEPRQQQLIAERVIKEALNVRQTEKVVARLQWRGSGGKHGPTPLAGDAHVAEIENRLRERFGTKVHLRYREGKGSLEILFFNDGDLERILQIAGVGAD